MKVFLLAVISCKDLHGLSCPSFSVSSGRVPVHGGTARANVAAASHCCTGVESVDRRVLDCFVLVPDQTRSRSPSAIPNPGPQSREFSSQSIWCRDRDRHRCG